MPKEPIFFNCFSCLSLGKPSRSNCAKVSTTSSWMEGDFLGWEKSWGKTNKLPSLKTNMDTQNSHTWKEIHLKKHHSWYLWQSMLDFPGVPSLKLTAKAPENRPSQKERIIFQPTIFRCELKGFFPSQTIGWHKRVNVMSWWFPYVMVIPWKLTWHWKITKFLYNRLRYTSSNGCCSIFN